MNAIRLFLVVIFFCPASIGWCQVIDQGSNSLVLRKAVREKCLSVLRSGLRGDDFWPAMHAAEGLTLGGYGDEVRAHLTRKLKTERDDQRRCGLARELVRAGDRAEVRVMLNILAGRDPHGHTHAAESLFKVNAVGNGEALRAAFKQQDNVPFRLMAAAALARHGDRAALTLIRDQLKSRDDATSRLAAWILARIGDASDIPQLQATLRASSDELTRCQIEHALAALRAPGGLAALTRNLASNDERIRTYAATFAGDARALGLADLLVKQLNDAHPDARIRAAQTLLSLALPPDPSQAARLLIDDHWVESRQNVKRVLHQPVKHTANPLIRGEKPWALNPYCYGTAIYDHEANQFKLWYMSYNHGLPLASRTPILFANSDNGLSWQRPSLGVVSYKGSSQNNIVLNHYGHHDLYSPSVVKDVRDPDPARRYKMVWWDFPKGPKGYQDDGMCVAFSPDGIRWKKHVGNPVLHASKSERSISDVMSVMYDHRLKKFVVYAKGWADPWPAFRQIVRTESSDFVHWSKPEVVLRHAFNKRDPQSYGMVVSPYENLYLGLLCSYKKPGNETIDVQLAVSHDNRKWARVADQATFLPTGASGSWDDGMLFCAPLLLHNEQVRIYYGGWDGPHNTTRRRSGIGLATLKRDRFVSLDAGTEEGTITTRLLRNFHGTLYLNAAARNGAIQVEALNVDGKVLPGYSRDESIPFTGDSIAQPAIWKTRSRIPRIENGIRLRLHLRRASLYAFRAH